QMRGHFTDCPRRPKVYPRRLARSAEPNLEDPSDWLSYTSLMLAGKVTTPTLLMTGVLDRRTPMPQSEEYYAALKVLGVPATLLQFEGEYHGTGSKHSNFVRTQLYMISWFRKYSRATGG